MTRPRGPAFRERANSGKLRPLHMIDEQQILRQILASEFASRKFKNRRYSQRAFAQRLKISSGTLSSILNGTRQVSPKNAKALIAKLELEPEQRQRFEDIFDGHKGKPVEIRRELLDLDRFAAIASPLYFTLRQLLMLHPDGLDLMGIARATSLDTAVLIDPLQRLLRLNLIANRGDLYFAADGGIVTPEQTTPAVRQYHREALRESQQALESLPKEIRNFTSLTFTGNPEQLNEVRELIRKFGDSARSLMALGKASEVYRLNIQLYPVLAHLKASRKRED